MKKTRFTDKAQMLKILSHPVRLLILEKLLSRQECVSDILSYLGMSQPGVSQHLAILKKAGIVSCRKKGTLRCYYLVDRSFVEKLFSLLKYTDD